MSVHCCPSMECMMSGHKLPLASVPAEDFGSDTLTDLERARTVAVELEQENAALLIRIANARARLTGAMYRGEISEELRAKITAELAGDEVRP